MKKIYDTYNFKQYYNESWSCEIDDNEVPMTIVIEVTDMYEATGEDEYKDYPVVFQVGLLNKNVHNSIDCGYDGDVTSYDVVSYYGMNCYIGDQLHSMDELNKNIKNELTINQACVSKYNSRFTNTEKEYLKFKTEEDALSYAEKLVSEYGDTIMSLIGFTLDKPINLAGHTGWKQTELFEKGEKNAA